LGRSNPEVNLLAILKEEFPHHKILEQYAIHPNKRKTLYLDFYIPRLGLVFETDGRQHYKYVPFFHGSLDGFLKSKYNDFQKEQWCEENGLTIIRLNTKLSVDKIRKAIADKCSSP
jgi:very-short-patch-repair endonuclease